MLTEATPEIIDILVEHHAAMFREIHAHENQPVHNEDFAAMTVMYRKKLTRQLEDNTCKAWTIRKESRIIATAALSLYDGIPIPTDPSITIGYLHSVFTVPGHRKCGYATRLVKESVAFCRDNGINRIDLAASSAGRKIYERLGFTVFPYAMRLIIPHQSSERAVSV
jgi:GNAT superfamily N-acetyltransferase